MTKLLICFLLTISILNAHSLDNDSSIFSLSLEELLKIEVQTNSYLKEKPDESSSVIKNLKDE